MADLLHTRDLKTAFREYEREVRIHNYRVACILAMVFMPVGGVLDYFVLGPTKGQNPDYSGLVWPFFLMRLLCSLLLLFIWWVVRTPIGLRHHVIFGQIVAALPSFFISVMISQSGGANSPYYAGINLVLLGAGLVLRWTLLDSVMVVITAMVMYVMACVSSPGLIAAIHNGILFNNLYFLSVTGVFVIIGSYFYNRIRYREFALRYELDQNRRELEETNQKLLELDQVKSRFFANISHELRTPLTLLLAPLETMLQRQDLQAATQSLLRTMHSNGMRLLKLINDLLDLVRLESGRMEIRMDRVQIDAFIKGLASAAHQVADDKRLNLIVKVDPSLGTVMIDQDKLEKVILNLTFNALKFTPAGGEVLISAQRQNDKMVLVVQDTGMGIAPKQLPYIFDRFWQADGSSRRKYQGVGIGLALVKEFVTMQGGSVEVKSTEGKGTAFTVTLPIHPAAPAPVPETPAEEPAEQTGKLEGTVSSEEWLSNLYRRAELFPALTPVRASIRTVETDADGKLPTLLVADDEPDMLGFLKTQLSTDYKVLEAVDGQQAVEKATHFQPDIILLDMMMPEKDGLQACREIRDLIPTRNIPIILLTARADEDTKMAALNAGASDFLAKPFSTVELQTRIRNLVERQHFQRQLSRQNQALESANDRLKDTIHQLKETELQLVQTEKLASLGRMSAGIIHEINNPLNYANTGLMVLRKQANSIPPENRQDFMDVLQDIQEGIGRVQNIVTDLRMFSVKDGYSREPVKLADVTKLALRFLSHETDDIEVCIDIPDHLHVMANKNLMVQVLVNLVKNSVDAVRAKQFPEGIEPAIQLRAIVQDDRVLFTVRDNGIGIQSEHVGRIFDPFFTTKDQGQGMGLGLSLCYRIIQSFSGTISVDTKPGEYSEFTMAFPAADKNEA